MDKNFVNIDNLVRQRLGGVEEKEPAGSWDQMRTLLDKEMPQTSPVGLFYWRRTVGVVAALLVVGAASVVGYKVMSTAPNAKNTNGEIAAGSAISSPGASTQNTEADKASVAGTSDRQSAMDNNGQPLSVTVTNNVNNKQDAAGNEETSNDRTDMNGRSATAGNITTNNQQVSKLATASGNTINSHSASVMPAAGVANAAGTHDLAKNVNNKDIAGLNNSLVKNDVHAIKTKNAGADKMALSGNIPVTRSIAAINADKAINATKRDNDHVSGNVHGSNTAKQGKSENVANETGVPMFVTKSGNRISGDKLQKLNLEKARKNTNNNSASAIDVLKNKRVIQRIDVNEHFVRSQNGERITQMDTVSIVTLTEELGIITETKTIVPVQPKKISNTKDR